jgi:hypothetical protein
MTTSSAVGTVRTIKYPRPPPHSMWPTTTIFNHISGPPPLPGHVVDERRLRPRQEKLDLNLRKKDKFDKYGKFRAAALFLYYIYFFANLDMVQTQKFGFGKF